MSDGCSVWPLFELWLPPLLPLITFLVRASEASEARRLEPNTQRVIIRYILAASR